MFNDTEKESNLDGSWSACDSWRDFNYIEAPVTFNMPYTHVISVLATDRGIIKPMRRLERRACRDTLTELQNRTAYYEYNQVLDKHIANGTADFSILMVDVNFLKRMNDTHGHEKGNAYLKNAAKLTLHASLGKR